MNAIQLAATEALKSLYGVHKAHQIFHKHPTTARHMSSQGIGWAVSLAGALHVGFGLLTKLGVNTTDPPIIDCVNTLCSSSGLDTARHSKILTSFSGDINDVPSVIPIIRAADVNLIEGMRKVKTLPLNEQLEFCLRCISENGHTRFADLGAGRYKADWHNKFFK